MKKIFSVILLTFCLLHFIKAQNLGINITGNPANASAGLDVDFSNKGILIPRVALASLTDAATITSPATSLLVYSSGGAVADGYYYNSGIPAAPIWSLFITTASASNGCFTNWQLFTANGTFTVPAGITKIKVCVYGGGAGGGGGSSNHYGGGGGGAGGYAEGTYTVIPGTNYTITIGNAGTGGTPGNPGSNGGASSFGALISASGGQGGVSYVLGGIGGFGSGGYLNTTLGNGGGSLNGSGEAMAANGSGSGGTGGASNILNNTGGGGGGGGFGGGNGGYSTSTGTNALPNTGAGGGGGAGDAIGYSGGNGSDGKVIVFW